MLITLEGIDGSGKSTQAKLLAEYVRDLGHSVTLTQEPSYHNGFAGQLRDFIKQAEDITPMARLFLFQAARAEHYQKVIKPALEVGEVVISDRYIDSTTAYQQAEGVDAGMIAQSNEWAIEKRYPDLTLFINVPVDKAMSRVVAREGAVDPNERSALFQRRVSENYWAIWSQDESKRFRVVDGDKPIEEVANEVGDYFEVFMRKSKAEPCLASTV